MTQPDVSEGMKAGDNQGMNMTGEVEIFELDDSAQRLADSLAQEIDRLNLEIVSLRKTINAAAGGSAQGLLFHGKILKAREDGIREAAAVPKIMAAVIDSMCAKQSPSQATISEAHSEALELASIRILALIDATPTGGNHERQ